MLMDSIQRLNVAAQNGNMEELYAVMGEDPYVLESIDKIPFVQTPLHIATSAGHSHFAIEIFSLKPSFGLKLNPFGQSPLHLAVPLSLAEPLTPAQADTEKRQTETAIRLINIDRELVRVQGRDRMTPLHHAAEKNKFDLLAEFLCACPASIEDLTIRGETAVHVAVRNSSFKSFQVILGWHRKLHEQINWTYLPFRWFTVVPAYKGVLRWKNEDGDTALHIAASTNQPQVVKLLMNKANMNYKNLKGRTVLDSGYEHQEVKDILLRAGASRGSSVSNSTSTLADFMSESVFRLIHRKGLSGDTSNMVLVVAVLIATTTFQVPLNSTPRSGSTGLITDHNNSSSSSSSKVRITTTGGTITYPVLYLPLLLFNSIAFFTSIGIITFTLQTSVVTYLLQVCLLSLSITYFLLVTSLSLPENFYVCLVLFVVLYVAMLHKVIYTKREIRIFSAIPIGRCNPSRFFEMRRRMIGW